MEMCSVYLAKAGDQVVTDHTIQREVVLCSESDSYADDFPKSKWPSNTYVGKMIREENGALIFFPAASFSGDHPTSIVRAATK